MKLRKNVEQLATEYVAIEYTTGECTASDKEVLRKGYLAGARDMLEAVSEIVFDKGFTKIPRLQNLINDLIED